MAEALALPCPLCAARQVSLYLKDRRRDYWQCAQCQLVFVPGTQHLSAAEEKAHYDFHENDPSDAGYRRFLGRLCDPMLARLSPGAVGLDFGAGPGPTLSLMFEEAGHPMAIYDLYYAPDESVLARNYDFVTASEVVEHLSRPGEELQRLWALIRPGGWLGLMTKRVTGREAFARWHYKNDPTHISFFSRATFDHLGRRWVAEPHYPSADVVLFQKP
ncbi:MAG: class I SAM-dependent methyltransferase [Gammaproteobacteria bacterium]|nr:MAG: class I SAM-dependent methyltransferase [Gammaproteobacteria bacterium]